MNMFETSLSGNSFIDENHHDLLEHLASLTPVTEGRWSLPDFQENLRDFIIDIENHFSHEEIVLRGANYKDLDGHTLAHRRISLEMHNNLNREITSISEAKEILTAIHHDVISHELEKDQSFWYLFDDTPEKHKYRFIEFTEDMLTGNQKIDHEHLALLNHLNRYLLQPISREDIDEICYELNLLSLYSKYHFEQEELALNGKLAKSHKANHKKLINDLCVLIDELKQGKFKTSDLKDYLSFWFYNHIVRFDVPAFKNKN